MGLEQYIISFIGFTNSTVIPFLLGIAFLVFIINVFRFFIVGGANSDAQEKAKALAVYGVGAFVLIIIFWGIVNILNSSLGLTRVGDIIARCPDYVCQDGGGSGNTGSQLAPTTSPLPVARPVRPPVTPVQPAAPAAESAPPAPPTIPPPELPNTPPALPPPTPNPSTPPIADPDPIRVEPEVIRPPLSPEFRVAYTTIASAREEIFATIDIDSEGRQDAAGVVRYVDVIGENDPILELNFINALVRNGRIPMDTGVRAVEALLNPDVSPLYTDPEKPQPTGDRIRPVVGPNGESVMPVGKTEF